MEEIRAFIAIELPERTRQSVARVQQELQAGSRASAKWVEPGNIHLTLKFLGNIQAAITGEIIQAMEGAVRGISSIRLGVEGLGAFPSNQRAQVIWVGLTGDLEKLSELQRRIDAALAGLGFPGEKRPFSPHLTIARLRDRATPADRKTIGQLIATTGFQSGLDFSADSVHLMKSKLAREGPIYSRLGVVRLG